MSCLPYYRQAQLHATLPNFNLTGANRFITLDVILHASFATYTLYLVATFPNTCDSCTYVLRNTFGHLEVFVLITYRYLCFGFFRNAVLKRFSILVYDVVSIKQSAHYAIASGLWRPKRYCAHLHVRTPRGAKTCSLLDYIADYTKITSLPLHKVLFPSNF